MERFLDYFTPEKYYLELGISRTKSRLKGHVIIDGYLHQDQLKLHAVDLKIQKVICSREQTGDSQPCPYQYDGETLSINFSPLSFGTIKPHDEQISLKIFYETALNTNMQGCYLSSYESNGAKQEIVATQFESHYAREAFPCVDEPAAKAEFALSLTIEDLQPEDVVLSNMPLAKQNSQCFAFDFTPRMSTYLLAWVVGPLQSVSATTANGIKVSSYGALNQSLDSLNFANETAVRALEYYEDKFKIPYPLEKFDQVALPDFEAGAMENWGLVTFRESCMLASPDAPLSLKRHVATVVTHELAHQWFGNLVTMQWWDDLWLNEAFATIMEYFTTDALYPDFNIWQDFFTGDCLAALERDALPGVQAVKQPVHHPAEIGTLFDSAIVYAKGARLVYMLIELMGEENFHQGITNYLTRHQYHNTTGDDLWAALQPYADFDVKAFMDAWISQPGYPEITGADQQRFLIAGSAEPETWPLPKLRDDMSGHYLINLDDNQFHQKLNQFNQFSLEQQLRLLIDRMLLAKTPIVPSASLLELLPKFVHHPSAAVWRIVLDIITDLKLFCPPETEGARNYQQYLCRLLRSEFDQLEYIKLQDDNATKRRNLLFNVALYAEDKAVITRLAELYQNDLIKLDPELRNSILAAKLKLAEPEIFDHIYQSYCTANDPDLKNDLLFILASSPKWPEHLQKIVSWLDQPEIVRPQDHIFLFAYLMRNYRTRELALDWLVAHWDYVLQLTGDKSVEDYLRYVAATITTPGLADKFLQFCNTLKADYLQRGIDMARTGIEARLQLIKLDAPAVQAKLREV